MRQIEGVQRDGIRPTASTPRDRDHNRDLDHVYVKGEGRGPGVIPARCVRLISAAII